MKKLSKKNTINNRLGKISNKIYLQNKYIRNDKELLEILKLILNKRKNKKRNNSHSNIIKKHQEHRNEKQGAVGSDIINEVNHYIPRSILDHNININNYKELEYKQNELMNKINNMRLENGEKLLLENKRENPIRWYQNEPELLEVVRESFRGNPAAGQKLLTIVPETKEFMEEIHKMGRSEVLHEAEKKLMEIEEDYNKLNDDYYELQHSKDLMAKQIEEKEEEFQGLENLTKKQKEEFDNLLLNYSDASEKLMEIKKELEDRTKEIDELNEAKRQAEKKAEDEFKIRTNLEQSKKEVDEEKKGIVKDVIKLKRDNRKSNLRLMTVEQLKHIVKDKSKITRGIKKPELLEIIYNEEGLNEPVVTPAKIIVFIKWQ